MCFLVGHNILLNFRLKVTIVHRVSLVVVIVMMSSGSTSMANAGTKGRINFLFLGALSRVKLYCFWNV